MIKSYIFYFITLFTEFFSSRYIKVLGTFNSPNWYFTYSDNEDRGILNVIKSLLCLIFSIVAGIVFIWSLFKLKWYYCLLIGIFAEIISYYTTGIIRHLEDDFFMFFAIPFIQTFGIIVGFYLILSYL